MRRLLADFARGMGLPIAGARLVWGDRRLMALAALPTLLGALATGLVFSIAWSRGEGWLASVWTPPVPPAHAAWLERLFSGLEALAWWSAWFTVVVISSAGAGWCAGRGLAAPVMDALAGRAMLRLGVEPDPGAVPFAARSLSSTALASILRAVSRLIIYLLGALLIASIALVPGGAALAAPLQAVWAAAWLLTDQLLYALPWVGEGRLADVAAFVRGQPASCAGFALVTTFAFAVPFAGLLIAPLGVAGACVLVARSRRARTEKREAFEAAVTSPS